jgi:hypothetical protein
MIELPRQRFNDERRPASRISFYELIQDEQPTLSRAVDAGKTE